MTRLAGKTVDEPMANEPKFVYSTSTGGGPPVWLRVWLAIAAVATGVVLLWFGLVLALAVVITVAVVLLPVWVWRILTAPRRPAAPATIEGEYSTTSRSSVDEARDRKSAGDAGGPSGHA